MNRTSIRDVLKEHVASTRTRQPNLWPSILGKVEQIERTSHAWEHPGQPLRARRLILGGAFATVLVIMGTVALLAFLTLGQPKSVSAAEVLAKAEQVVKGETTGLQSFYGNYLFHYRNSPTEPFIEIRDETWFQSPDKVAYRHTTDLENGEKYSLANGRDSAYSYTYRSEYNQLWLWGADVLPGDATKGTLQMLLFSPANLTEAMERARRELRPAQNPKSDPRPPYMYDVKFIGEENVIGRKAYVLELTMVPGASLQLPDSQVPETMKMWVDQEVYAVLRLEGWNAEGELLQSGIYETFQVNQGHQANQADIRGFFGAQGADVLELNFAEANEVEQAWQETIKRASYQLFKPARVPDGLYGVRPLYDAERGVTSQVYQGEILLQRDPLRVQGPGQDGEARVRPREGQDSDPRRVTIARLGIIQGPPSVISEDGLGASTSVQIGSLTGRLYTRDGISTLIFDMNNTRIKLQAPLQVLAGASPESAITVEQLVQIAESMQPVSVK